MDAIELRLNLWFWALFFAWLVFHVLCGMGVLHWGSVLVISLEKVK